MTIFKNLPGEGRESDYLINNRVSVGAEEVLNVESGDGAGPKVVSYLNWSFSQLQIYSSPFYSFSSFYSFPLLNTALD